MATYTFDKIDYGGNTYVVQDSGALQLTGGTVTGPVTFGDSITVDEATLGDLVVNGNASFTNNIQANTINGVAVGSSPKFTDTTYNFIGVTFYSGNSGNATHDANAATANGHYYYTSNGPATSLGASTADGALYVQSYSDSWVGQIAQDYRNGALFVRGKNNGTWQSWQKVYDTAHKPTASDVGLGNVENKSSATIRGELTSSNVTTALGYIPYNSTNPSGYTTNTGTVTKVTAGTGLSIGTTAGGNFTTSGTINHTNSVTAQTTQAVYPIKIDAQGHISAYGSAVTIPTITLNGSTTTSPSFYAPTGAGTSGQFLKSSGSGQPTWSTVTIPTITQNGSATTTPSFYAPVTAGTSGHVLKSNGSGAPTWTSATLTDTMVTTAALTSGTTYYPILATETGTATRQIDSTLGGLKYTSTAGNSSTIGKAILQLGNNLTYNATNNERGILRLYSTFTAYSDLVATGDSNLTFTLPAVGGQLALVGDAFSYIWVDDASAYISAYNSSTITLYAGSGISMSADADNGSITISSPAISTTVVTPTVTASTGTKVSAEMRKYGNVVQFTLTFKNTASVASGSEVFVGTLSTNKPLQLIDSACYFGSHALIMSINTSGGITIRNASNSAVTCNSNTMIGATWLV